MRPGPEVLASFGASADPVSLPGGEGTAWRAGEAVLKPAGDPWVARWTADLYLDLDPLGPLTARRDAGFRVPRPLRTAAGDWLAQDPLTGAWVAWQWLPGEPAAWASCWPVRTSAGWLPRSSPGAATRTLLPGSTRSRGPASR
jgi:hypothetical protein